MFELPIGADDDPAFTRLVRRIIVGLLDRVVPHDVFLVQIDNWFDHKWLDLFNVESEAPLNEHTPIPMFNPSRVVHQEGYSRDASLGRYRQAVPHKDVHGDDGVFRGKHRRLADLTTDGVFVWYGGRTSRNRRGSLMAIAFTRSFNFAWYVSLVQRKTWAIDRAKGITPREVWALAESGSQNACVE